MEIQRLRNLTTGRLHTKMEDIYEDLETVIGEALMTHMLPRAIRAIEPWLREHVKDQRFWDGEYDPSHQGEFELPEATEQDRRRCLNDTKLNPTHWLARKLSSSKRIKAQGQTVRTSKHKEK